MKHLYLDVGVAADEAVKGSSDVKAYLLFSAVSAESILLQWTCHHSKEKKSTQPLTGNNKGLLENATF